MTKILLVLIVASLSVSFVGCENSSSNPETVSKEEVTTIEEPSAKEEQPSSPNSSNNSSAITDEEWRQFLKDYEAWVDNYIEVLKKYKENPADQSILSDYIELSNQLAGWSYKADEFKDQLKYSPEMLKEYLDTILRITQKLSEATQ